MIDLDRPVRDRLLLRTVPGAVDYLFEELRQQPAVTVIGRRRDGIVIELDGPLRALADNRYFSTAAVLPDDTDRHSRPTGPDRDGAGPNRPVDAPGPATGEVPDHPDSGRPNAWAGSAAPTGSDSGEPSTTNTGPSDRSDPIPGAGSTNESIKTTSGPARNGDPDRLVAGLRHSADTGVLSLLPGPLRFRVGDLGDARWPIRDRLTATGWHNTPHDWDINLEPDPAGPLAEIGALHWTRRFGKLLRAPASTTPVIAAVMTRLAKIEPGHTVLDPFCGAGTLLVSAADTARPARLLGSDHTHRWITATDDNLADRHPNRLLWRGDARYLPLPDDSVDRVVANLPFGKRVGSHLGNRQLYPAALAEIARVLTRRGRAVLLTEDKRLFTQTVQRTRGIRVIKEIVFATGGAHPSAYVVATRRGR